MIAIYGGSFDPITNGHLDIIRRATKMFQPVIVAIGQNSSKKTSLFTVEERLELIRRSCKDAGMVGIEADAFDGLLVTYAMHRRATALVRGLRFLTDFEGEFQLALCNKEQWEGCETVFLMTDARNLLVSSSIVKELAKHGGTVDRMVPACVASALRAKFQIVGAA